MTAKNMPAWLGWCAASTANTAAAESVASAHATDVLSVSQPRSRHALEKPAPGTVKIRKMITATLNSAIAISSWSRQYAVASDTTAAVADCQNM